MPFLLWVWSRSEIQFQKSAVEFYVTGNLLGHTKCIHGHISFLGPSVAVFGLHPMVSKGNFLTKIFLINNWWEFLSVECKSLWFSYGSYNRTVFFNAKCPVRYRWYWVDAYCYVFEKCQSKIFFFISK